jgi:hypothetical protein
LLKDPDDIATDKIIPEPKPFPDESLPKTSLLECQNDEVAEENPTRALFDDRVEEKPVPNIVILVLPLKGAFVKEMSETETDSRTETLNDPLTPPESLTTISLTEPRPEVTLKAKELSELQIVLSDEDA